MFRHRRRLPAIYYVFTLYTIIVRLLYELLRDWLEQIRTEAAWKLHGLRKMPVWGSCNARPICLRDSVYGQMSLHKCHHNTGENVYSIHRSSPWRTTDPSLDCGDRFKAHNLLPTQTHHLTDANVRGIYLNEFLIVIFIYYYAGNKRIRVLKWNESMYGF